MQADKYTIPIILSKTIVEQSRGSSTGLIKESEFNNF